MILLHISNDKLNYCAKANISFLLGLPFPLTVISCSNLLGVDVKS